MSYKVGDIVAEHYRGKVREARITGTSPGSVLTSNGHVYDSQTGISPYRSGARLGPASDVPRELAEIMVNLAAVCVNARLSDSYASQLGNLVREAYEAGVNS